MTPEASYAMDAAVEQIAHDLNAPSPAQFTAVRYPGLDNAGHYYLRYAMPRAFGDVSDEERIQYGRVLEQYYTYVDGIVGRAMASMASDDLLLVVSGFGMEPLSFGKRVLERLAGDPQLSGTHEGAPDGFLIVPTAATWRKAAFPRASVVDVARRCCIFSACRSRATWTASPARTSSRPRSRSEGPVTFILFMTGRRIADCRLSIAD